MCSRKVGYKGICIIKKHVVCELYCNVHIYTLCYILECFVLICIILNDPLEANKSNKYRSRRILVIRKIRKYLGVFDIIDIIGVKISFILFYKKSIKVDEEYFCSKIIFFFLKEKSILPERVIF